jgi:transcriptional regulator with XRE-family HTH domain
MPDKIELKELGANLKYIREKNKQTLEALAIETDLDDRQISKIEKGERDATLSTNIKLMRGLKVEPNDIYPHNTFDGQRKSFAYIQNNVTGSDIELKEFGNNVKACRERQGLGPGQLASLASMGQTQIDNIEKGESNIRSTTIIKLIWALKVEPNDLFHNILMIVDKNNS